MILKGIFWTVTFIVLVCVVPHLNQFVQELIVSLLLIDSLSFMGPKGLFPCSEEPVASVQSARVPFRCSWLFCQCFEPIFYIAHKLCC